MKKIIVLLVSLLTVLSLWGCSEKNREYRIDGLTLKLPEEMSFERLENENYDYAMISDSSGVGVWIIHYRQSWLEELQLGDYDLEDFVYLIGYETDTIKMEILEDRIIKEYYSQEEDYELFDFNVILDCDDGFYRVIFDCFRQDQEKYEKKFRQWAEDIAVSQ